MPGRVSFCRPVRVNASLGSAGLPFTIVLVLLLVLVLSRPFVDWRRTQGKKENE